MREIDTLSRAWRAIRENGQTSRSIDTRREIDEFALTAEARLTRIQRQLNRNSFEFKPAKGIPILKKDKKGIRPLVVAPIVQRAIHDVLVDVPSIRQFTEHPYSFGGVRKQPGEAYGGVPAAIHAVLQAISDGQRYIIRTDISSFFTRIPKSAVTEIVSKAIGEPDFMDLFAQAIKVELDNISSLRERLDSFPIHEIGVAQGNSLSPLLGNLLLYDFDIQMNAGQCACLRYIDDFMILAPDRAAGERQLALGIELLAKQGMSLSQEKTFRGDVDAAFSFLGVEFANGAIRPSKESRRRMLKNISELLEDSARSMRSCSKTRLLDPKYCLIRTLSEVRGMALGWGKHYFFCNEKNVLRQMDFAIDQLIRQYLGSYRAYIKHADATIRRRLLGVPLLAAC